jgi:rRNA maturation RNase YbeY
VKNDSLVSFESKKWETSVKEDSILSWLSDIARLTGNGERYCSVLFTGPGTIREMNKQYRGIDTVTDVLSFSQIEGDSPVDVDGGFIGDIVICMDRAMEQAESMGHSLQEELNFLLLHGFLHLLGYDHENDEDSEMEKLQGRIYFQLTGVTLE